VAPVHDVYADCVSGTPLDERVAAAMEPFLGESFCNPSSLHRGAAEPRRAIDAAREQVAALVRCSPEEVVFTSGATEANNLAIKGSAWASGRRGRILISSVEHISVRNPARRLSSAGFVVEEIPVGGDALVDPSDVERAVREDTVLVCVNLANPEVGTVEPVEEIARLTRERGVTFHCDAAVAAGWMEIDFRDLGADLLTLSAHNFYGPKGAGALCVRSGVRLVPLVDGGPQESGLRAGTENVAAIVGMGVAAELAARELVPAAPRLEKLRDELVERVLRELDGAVLTGHRTARLPGHASFCFEGVEGEAVVADLDAGGVAAASGSACSSATLKVSHVLSAMGVEETLARGSLIISLGRDAGEEAVRRIADLTVKSVRRLRELSPI